MGARIALYAGLLAAGAAAADDPARLPPLEVTAEPTAAYLSSLDAVQIESSPALGLTELLRQLPGVHVDRLGGRGAVSSLYLRGADPNFTAVYLDGVKVNDPTNTRGGSVDFSSLVAEDIERIELLSGPASALLGADALAGAINIVTRRGTGERSGGATWVGGDGVRRGAASLADQAPGFGYALRAGLTDLAPDPASGGATTRSVGANVDAAWPLQLSFQHARAELSAFPEDSGGPRYAERRALDRRGSHETVVGARSLIVGSHGLDFTVAGGWYERREVAVSPGVAPGPRDLLGIPASRSDSRLTRADVRAAVQTRIDALAVTAGFQAGEEEGRSDGELDLPLVGNADFALERDGTAAFADLDYGLARGLQLEGSARADELGGEHRVTRRARVAYPLGPLTASFGYAEGFKLPSFYALGNPTVGNPALLPEESRSRELALLYALGRFGDLRAVRFRASYVNAIDFEEGPPPRLVNRALMTCDGFELGARLTPWSGFEWQLGATRVVAALPGSDERLRNRPRWTGASQARWQLRDAWAVMLAATYVGANLDSSIPTGDRVLPAYWRYDGALEWRALSQLAVRAAVENLLDEEYEELVGFPGPDRAGRLEVRIPF